MCNIHRRGKRNVKIAFNIFDFCMQIIIAHAHVLMFLCLHFFHPGNSINTEKNFRSIDAISLFA